MLQAMPVSHRVRGPSDDVDAIPVSDSTDTDDVMMLPVLEIQELSTSTTVSISKGKLKNGKKKTVKTKPNAGAKPSGASKVLFLDGLRGLAAMLVIVQHLSWLFEKKARTLFEQNASKKTWALALFDYTIRRFLRVYPLFMIVAIYLTVYSPAEKEKLFRVHHPENYNVLKVLTFEFKQRYHVFWTLPLEITYYFIIPVFVVMMLKLKKYWVVPVLPLSYLVMYSGFYWFRLDHMPLKPHLPTFLCGSMAAIIYAKVEQWIEMRQFQFRWYHTVVLRVVEMASLAILFSTVFNGLFFDWVVKNPIPQTHGGHFVSATVSIIIVCEMLQRGAISSVLEWSLLRYAGKVSFSMYSGIV